LKVFIKALGKTALFVVLLQRLVYKRAMVSIALVWHSFATHLLDKGTDVTIIMKLLGHNDIRTTMRYLHVTNLDILQILSPLDDLNLG